MPAAVLTEIEEGVLKITLNRPEARNSLNLELVDQLAATLKHLDEAPGVVAGVLQGADEFVSAGMDLKAFLAGEKVWDGDAERLGLKEVGANGPLAIVATKEILVRQADWDEEEFWIRQREISDPVFGSADAIEGSRAFAEKRPPRWRGA